MKKKKNKIDLNKINVRGIVAVTIAIAASVAPSESEPVSPINTFAGCVL